MTTRQNLWITSKSNLYPQKTTFLSPNSKKGSQFQFRIPRLSISWKKLYVSHTYLSRLKRRTKQILRVSVYLIMKYFSTLLFSLILSTGFSQSDLDFFTVANKFLETHCSEGKVDYTAVKTDPNLPKLIEYIGTNPSPVGKEKAYLINVYNLFVIRKLRRATLWGHQ